MSRALSERSTARRARESGLQGDTSAHGTTGHKEAKSDVPKPILKTATRSPKRTRVAEPSLCYEQWLIEQLRDPAEAAAYVEAVKAEGDQAAITLALRQVAQAQHVAAAVDRKTWG
jgi:hypothetical protein